MKHNFYTNKFRAELFTNSGLALISVMGISWIRILVFKEEFLDYFNWRGVFTLIFFCFGVFLIFKALDVYELIDNSKEKESKYE